MEKISVNNIIEFIIIFELKFLIKMEQNKTKQKKKVNF